MKPSPRRRKWARWVVAGVILLLAYWISWPWPAAESRGRLAANLDQALGRSALLVYGLGSPESTRYYQLLHQRYCIRVVRVADCIVSRSLAAYADAYDQVSSQNAVRKHGRDIFEECYQQAKADIERDTHHNQAEPSPRSSPSQME
jgi:hypothetical protein